jgi:hypothetical protein
MPTSEEVIQRAVLEALASLVYICQEETPVLDVEKVANECLAEAGLPFRYEWNHDEWRFEVHGVESGLQQSED